jgi:transmembrane sensor
MERNIKELLQKGSLDFINKKEQQEILSLFHQEDIQFHVKAELTDILERTNVIGDDGKDIKHLFEKIWERICVREEKYKRRVFPTGSMLRMAASLLLGLVIGSVVLTKHGRREQLYYTSMAPKGSVAQMILPDSTFICLNSGSTLKYSIDGIRGNREVFLEGEAWFQVRRAEDKPFIVHTGFYDVNVKGTEFNIKAYAEDDDVVTTLEKGSIILTPGKTDMKEESVLKSGQQLIYNKGTGNMAVESVNPRLFSSWKENKLIFINMSLRELVVLLERKYGVDIRVKDPVILDYHYDGTIKNESIIKVLNLIKLTLPVNFEIKDQTIEITRK